MRSERVKVTVKVIAAMALAMVALSVPAGSEAAPTFEVKKLLAPMLRSTTGLAPAWA